MNDAQRPYVPPSYAESKATRAEADAFLKLWREDLFGRGAR
jgi:hypothetical protein